MRAHQKKMSLNTFGLFFFPTLFLVKLRIIFPILSHTNIHYLYSTNLIFYTSAAHLQHNQVVGFKHIWMDQMASCPSLWFPPSNLHLESNLDWSVGKNITFFCCVVLAVEKKSFAFLYFVQYFWGFISGVGCVCVRGGAHPFCNMQTFIIICIKCTVCLQNTHECLSFLKSRNK